MPHSTHHGSHRDPHRDPRGRASQRPGQLAHDPDEPQYDEDLFWYTQAFPNLIAGGTAQESLQIDADAHFRWTKTTYYSTLHTGTAPFTDDQIPELTLTLRDGGAGRDLTYSPIPLSSLAGTARLPALLPLYRIFRAKSTIIFTLVNFSATNQYDNTQVTLWGTKLFPTGPTG